MNIVLNIERLVLDGLDLPPQQGPLLQAAVEAELTRLLAAHGLSSSLYGGGAVPVIRGGHLDASKAGPTPHLGQQIAQAVFSGMGGTSNTKEGQ
jgi:hypothetical protein